MFTLDDLIDWCELSEDEIDAIARHEHVSELIAAEMGESLVKDPDGRERVCTMIRETVQRAEAHGANADAERYRRALNAFSRRYPEAG